MTLQQLKSSLVDTHPYMFLLGGFERIAALSAHIAFSLLVLYAVRYRKINMLLLAILLHALMDFPAALYQVHMASIWITEGLMVIVIIVAVVFIIKSQKLFVYKAET